MATTKVSGQLLDLNAGRADYSLTATNTVTYVGASGGNQYVFNGAYGTYGVVNGTYVLSSVSSSHPIAIINNGKTSEISYTGAVNEGTGTGPDGNTYTFYSGDVTITVSGDFDTVSYYCLNHGYMGGKDNLIYVNSVGESGLKMPSGTELNRPTDATGQIRNNTNESSNGGASAMEYYNGTDWKKISNDPPPAPPPVGFNAVTYTGTGATQSINVGFQPDIIWTKAYSVSDNHRQYNSVRGTSKILYPNLSSFEDTNSTFLTSFDSNGFTLGSGNGSNQLNRDYVAFCWSAGGGSNNPQASDTTGVAIRTYSGNEVQNRALSHGLTSAPVMETVKNYSGSVPEFWCHLVNPPMTGTGYVYRNNTNAFTLSGSSTIFGLLPDATNFYVSNNTFSHELTNGSGNSYINFLFSNIDGFSKIDTFTGANATVNVNVGFQPNMVIIKNASSSSTDWLIFDTARDTGPTLTKVLNWNNANAEVTFGNGLTLTSTGFSVPSATLVGDSFNKAGDTFSYMAFKIN